jgi:hypothetical protein
MDDCQPVQPHRTLTAFLTNSVQSSHANLVDVDSPGSHFCVLPPLDVISLKLLKKEEWGAKGSCDPEFRHYPRRIRLRHQTVPFSQPAFEFFPINILLTIPLPEIFTMRTANKPRDREFICCGCCGFLAISAAKLGFFRCRRIL